MIYLIITTVFFFYALYLLLNMAAALFYTKPKLPHRGTEHCFLLFYPAYRPDKKFVQNLERMQEELQGLNAKLYVLSQEADESINQELKQIADYFDAATFSNGEGNAYHKALQFAVGQISRFSTRQQKIRSVLLMDPDNYTDRKSIERLLSAREEGADVVLSRRISISEEGQSSLFDGLSERINDYMMRRSKMVLGLLPELSGSGMMMDRKLFEQAVMKLDRKAPGMDKQLLINMMFSKQDLNIVFDEGALVYDEKTEDSDAFNRQRQRWFGNQYYNASVSGRQLFWSMRASMIDYAVALWRPPRSVQVLVSLLFAPIDLLLYLKGWIPAPLIAASALALIVALSVFLLNEGKWAHAFKKSLSMASISFLNAFSAFRSLLPGNSGRFIHTRVNS